MKNTLKIIILLALFSGAMQSCDEKTDLPYYDNPFFKETFEEGTFSNWTIYNELGTQEWGTVNFGNPGVCAKMSGFANSANNANIDWLISPVQDLSGLSNASINFDNAYKFAGNPIEVYVSNNYSGTGNPNASGITWTKINGANLSSGNYVYVNSGNLDISNFTGDGNSEVYIAFKYTCDTSASSTWELDNIKIYGN